MVLSVERKFRVGSNSYLLYLRTHTHTQGNNAAKSGSRPFFKMPSVCFLSVWIRGMFSQARGLAIILYTRPTDRFDENRRYLTESVDNWVLLQSKESF